MKSHLFRSLRFSGIDVVYIFSIILFFFIKDTKDAAHIFESTQLLTSNNTEYLLPLLATYPFRFVLSGLGYTLFNAISLVIFTNYLASFELIQKSSKYLLLFFPISFYWFGQTLKDSFNCTMILWLSFFLAHYIFSLSSILDRKLFKVSVNKSLFVCFVFLSFLIRPTQYLALILSAIYSFTLKLSKSPFPISFKFNLKQLLLVAIMIAFSAVAIHRVSTLFNVSFDFDSIKLFLYRRITRNDANFSSVDGSQSDLFNPPELILRQPLLLTYLTQLFSFICGPILLLWSKLKITYVVVSILAVLIASLFFIMVRKSVLNSTFNQSTFSFFYWKFLLHLAFFSWLSLPIFLNNAGNLFRYSLYPTMFILFAYAIRKKQLAIPSHRM